MDTPAVAAYYRESNPLKRKKILEKAIASGEDTKENEIRREIWEIRYGGTSEVSKTERADGFMALWMTLEFNRNADKKWFAIKRARKEITKHLENLKFQELSSQSETYRELLYRECVHLVRTYIELCETDKSYNNLLCGLISMSKERSREKLQEDIKSTAMRLPATLQLESELELFTKAAKEVYDEKFAFEEDL